MAEKRQPTFSGREHERDFMEPSEFITYLWGNLPALGVGPLRDDMIKLNPKHVCFAACGDLRDTITLVNALRANQQVIGAAQEPIDIVLNDNGPYV